MLQPELKLRRDKIRALMAQQGIDAALITCNVNLIYTYGRVVSGYLYLPLNAPARLFIKRPNDIEGEHIHPIRKPEQITGLLKECGLPLPVKLMLEGDELPFTEYNRLAACFPETEVVSCGTALIRQARSIKTPIEIEMFRRSGIAHAKAYEQIPGVYRPGMTDIEFSIEGVPIIITNEMEITAGASGTMEGGRSLSFQAVEESTVGVRYDSRTETAEEIKEKIASLNEKIAGLTEQWKSEKSQVDHIKDLKNQKVRLETQMAQFESQGNLEEASKIKYQTIPAINKEIEEYQAKENDDALLQEKVTVDTISEVISRK